MADIKVVESFWNANPCGMPRDWDTNDHRRIFEEGEKWRYSKQSRISKYADFNSSHGKKVLEIGCGIGTDGIQFARSGAIYTGVDLTDAAIQISKERFSLFGQQGEFIKLNAETLPFPDNYFDYIYSFGVIHHAPYPEKIVSEIYRVLKPGGKVTVMLYNRTSFYYLIEISMLRKVLWWFCNRKNFCNLFFSLFSRHWRYRFESFRLKLEKMKTVNKKPNRYEWVSMNTDDVFCPISRVYSKAESKQLFNAFEDFKSEVWFIDKDNWLLWLALGRFMPKLVQDWLEFNFGWFRMIQAEK